MSKSVSVIIPTYCGSDTLSELTQRLIHILTEQHYQFEILLIDDGSPDHEKTWTMVKTLSQTYHYVRGFRLLRNRGQHNALLLGIREALFETIVTLDDDLQNPPEESVRLLEQLYSQNVDVVYGIPKNKKHSWLRNLGSRLIAYILSFISGENNPPNISSFRAFKTILRNSFATHQSSCVSIDALLTWGATQYAALEVLHETRKIGRSGYTFRKLVAHALTMITHYSTLPLRIASLSGLVTVCLGFVLLLYVLLGKLLGFITQPGFTFIVTIIIILGGMQLLALGIMGEYLATIFTRSSGVMAYTVIDKTEHD